ncbi:MAG: hypothetical protein LWW95_07120 [Candidatus Desulfofervidus auxilii]|nr:hypothetical protein [Candidatus Desulfofervidus auxilii]
MTTALFDAFCNYLAKFQKIIQQSEGKRNLLSLVNKPTQLRVFVDEAERQQEFQSLLIATKFEFSIEERKCRQAIKNFFRNSSCYLDLFNGKKINIKRLFDLIAKNSKNKVIK